jgi:TolB protein
MALHAHRLLVLVSIAAVIGCGGDGGGTAPGQQLATVGRLERGSTIRLVARDGAAAADSVVSNVTVTPATAGAVSGVTLMLLQSGSVTVSARAGDGRTLSTTFDVAAPPTVYFDGVASGNRDVYSVSLDGRDLTRRTTSPADDAQPTVVAAAIVFVSTRDGNRELYSMPTTVGGGGAEQRLTTTAANESQPAFAAGGAALAYVSDVGGAPRAYVAPVPLANPARLSAATFGFAGSIEASPTWSPTRDRVAFVATANGSANLFIASATAGGTPVPVAGSGNGQTDVEPAWSPDGNRVAFASTRAGTTQIFLLDLRTGAFSQLTNDASPAGQPGWLSDGRLVFTRFEGGGSTLWWVDPSETAPPTQIPTTGVVQAAHATGAR